MAVNLGEMFVSIGADISKLQQGMKNASNSIKQAGSSMKSVGVGLTKSVTAPIAGIGVAALKMSTDFNSSMANVATLIPNSTERVLELKNSVQDLAIETGKSTDDLSSGLYQVISAFGDSAKSMEVLEVASKGAVAGVSDTESAINLLSAVLKGYNLEMDQAGMISDYAFNTVKLGQTTFSELAQYMGRVIPLAETLNVSQEELWGTMATLTGVTGNTARVSTQLKAAYQAIVKPTEDMAKAIINVSNGLIEEGKLSGEMVDKYIAEKEALERLLNKRQELNLETKEGKEAAKNLKVAIEEQQKAVELAASALGPAIVESQGFATTLNSLTSEADGNNAILGKMFGSVDALNAVLALTGAQSETWAKKIEAMGDVAGATDEAFKEQAEGVNKLGFEFSKLKQELAVNAQRLGDELAPMLLEVFDIIKPFIERIKELVNKFMNLDEETKKNIVKFAALAAGLGPLLVILGTVVSSVGSIIGVLGALLNPITLVIVAIGALVAWFVTAYKTNEEFKKKVDEAWAKIKVIWQGIMTFLNPILEQFKKSFSSSSGYISKIWNNLMKTFETLKPLLKYLWDMVIKPILGLMAGGFVVQIGVIVGVVNGFIKALGPLLETVTHVFNFIIELVAAVVAVFEGDFSGAVEHLKQAGLSLWEAFKSYLNTILALIEGFASGVLAFFDSMIKAIVGPNGTLPKGLEKILKFFADLKNNILNFASDAYNWGKNLISNLTQGIRDKMGELKEAVNEAVNKVKDFLGFSSPTKEGPGKHADEWAPNLMNMFSEGIRSSIPGLNNTLNSVLQPNLNPTYSSINTIASSNNTKATIIVELDGRQILRAIGQPLRETMYVKGAYSMR